MPKVALITGITGQDGAYLTELLLNKGYIVHGLKRRSSQPNTDRIEHLLRKDVFLHYGDLTDSANLFQVIRDTQPDEVYNLAAQSHVKVSFDTSEYTANVNALGTLRLLEAIRSLDEKKRPRFYQASTSELFGKVQEIPQKETTPFYPRSPYGVSKLFAYWCTINYRESYGLFACNGILYNHESPRRGESFVTRKITKAAARISLGLQDCLSVGNINAYRDWGHAADYVEGMWRMLQQDQPDDYILATGKKYSVREFIELAFAEVGIPIRWEGTEQETKGINGNNGKIVVEIDPQYFRPAEVELLIGDPTKAKEKLGWSAKIPLLELVQEMVQHDLKIAKS